MKKLELRSVLFLFVILEAFATPTAYGADPWPPAGQKKISQAKKKPANPGRTLAPIWSPSFVVNQTALPARTAVPLVTAPAAPTASENPKRILNIRLHPIGLIEMATRQDTLLSLRGDLDFVLGDKMTLGASVIYHKTSTQDMVALESGLTQSVDLGVLEVGLLSNIYLTGSTAAGGFILRPHVYWLEAHGEKRDASGAITPGNQSSNGARAGAEMIYQVITASGFNLEIGGGFSYHLVPFTVGYSDAGQTRSGPDNRLVPTVSAGVGWSF